MTSHGFQQKAIQKKVSFGARLKAARKKKRVSLETAERETRIRQHYLESLEEDHFHAVSPVYLRGFVRRYAQYLGISGDIIDRELSYLPSDQQSNPKFVPYVIDRESRWIVTPWVVGVVLSVVVLLGFIGYVTYQVQQFAAPPELVITSPSRESVVTTEEVVVTGQSEPGATVWVDNLSTSVASDGKFSYPVTLRPGLNQITVRAENRIKKQASTTVSVLYKPVEPSPSPSPEPTPPPENE